MLTKSQSILQQNWDISATNGRRIKSRQDLKRGSHALHACFGSRLIEAKDRSSCVLFRFFLFFFLYSRTATRSSLKTEKMCILHPPNSQRVKARGGTECRMYIRTIPDEPGNESAGSRGSGGWGHRVVHAYAEGTSIPEICPTERREVRAISGSFCALWMEF